MYTLGKKHNGRPLHLDEKTRRIHAGLVGATGAGKTTLFYNLMLDDLKSGRGFALIDPHGDIALKIADHIPPNRINDVVFLDVTDKEYAVGFNPLSSTTDPAVLTYNLVASFKYIYHDSWGPRLEYILGNALRLLLAVPGSTLVELPRLLVDEKFRDGMLTHCKDPIIRLFWEVEFRGYSERIRSEAILPIQNKIGQLVGNPTIRAIMGQESTFSIDDIINNQKILICNISKSMGDEPSHLLGAFLVTAIAQSAQARATIPEEERQDFTLYVDEFQNFATETFASILSEMRKYRLNLVVANQFMAQLPPLLRQSVLGNIGTLCVLRVGAEMGAQVRKGERGTLIIYYSTYEKEDDDGNAKNVGFIKPSSVFNCDQIDGWTPPETPDLTPLERLQAVDEFVQGTGAVVREEGYQAFYDRIVDRITMPRSGLFFDPHRTENYYAVLMHELVHWSGHPTRLFREMGKKYGDHDYAFEELVAELGSAFLCAKLGISPTVREDHACYIANWLDALKRDKRFIFSASSQAQLAVDYLTQKGVHDEDPEMGDRVPT